MDCTCFCEIGDKEGQPFDKLRVNGFCCERALNFIRAATSAMPQFPDRHRAIGCGLIHVGVTREAGRGDGGVDGF